MSDSETLQADYQALNDLIVNSPEFSELEAKLGDFNLFQVLRSEFSELKHSNVLGWLMNPSESHGLDATFLQKWLMRALHSKKHFHLTPVTPVDIDAWELLNVEVRREWQNTDLLLNIELARGERWIICIENKVHSSQHSNQLTRYRSIVEEEFSSATHRIYLLLSKFPETPDDEHYIPTSYAEVHQALTDTLALRKQSIGQEPRVLIDNYLRLLEEKFMNESDVARMAATIYQKHRRALDVIFENRPELVRAQVLPLLGKLLHKHSEELDIVCGKHEKKYIRFIPRAWDQPGNHHGQNWQPSNFGLVFEIDFFTTHPRFLIVAGKPPEPWTSHLQPLCDDFPFHHLPQQQRTGSWPRFYSEEIEVLSDSSLPLNANEAAETLFDWIKVKLECPDMEQVIDTIANELPKLDEIYRSQEQS